MIHNFYAFITSYAPHLRKHAFRFAYNVMSRFIFSGEPIAFLNYGYADDNTEMFRENLKAPDREDHLSIRLYSRLLDEIPIAHKRVMDVGCGRGGGSSYIARYLRPAEIIGVDFSTRSIAFCNRHHKVENLQFRVGDAENLRFEPNSFDVIVNVESSHAYSDESAFFASARRILAPNGLLCFCDVRPSNRLVELEKKIDESQLQLVWKSDISTNVLRALRLGSESRTQMIRQTFPKVMQQSAFDWAGVEGGAVARSFADGSRSYIACVLQKPANR